MTAIDMEFTIFGLYLIKYLIGFLSYLERLLHSVRRETSNVNETCQSISTSGLATHPNENFHLILNDIVNRAAMLMADPPMSKELRGFYRGSRSTNSLQRKAASVAH